MNKTMLGAFTVVFCVAGVAWAGIPVPIVNHSFEDDVVADGSSSSSVSSGYLGGGVDLYNPTGDGSGEFAGGIPDGSANIIRSDQSAGGGQKAAFWIDTNLVAGQTYTFSVDYGASSLTGAGTGVVQGYVVPDLNDPSVYDKPIHVGDPPAATVGGWTRLSYSFDTGVHEGWDLLIELADNDNQDGVIYWDNMSLVRTPEPMTMSILALGSLGLFLRRR